MYNTISSCNCLSIQVKNFKQLNIKSYNKINSKDWVFPPKRTPDSENLIILNEVDIKHLKLKDYQEKRAF